MAPSEVLLLAFLIGVVCGLRSLTAPAVVAWAAHRGWIQSQPRAPPLPGLDRRRRGLHSVRGRRAGCRSTSLSAQPHGATWSNRAHRSRRIVRSGHRGVGRAIHRDWRSFGRGGRNCRRVWRLSSPHAPGKGAESSGLRDRNIGRRGGDRRGTFHCVAILNRRLLFFQQRRVCYSSSGSVERFPGAQCFFRLVSREEPYH